MGGSSQTAMRDANGRFVPGQSGNPAGKKRGTRNRATLLREALADGESARVARIVIDKALAGDAVAARFIVDRLTPRPRGRAIALDLPEGAVAGDVLAASNATIAAMASGEITPDEALTVTRVLDGKLRALKAARGEDRTMQKSPSPLAGEGRVRGLFVQRTCIGRIPLTLPLPWQWAPLSTCRRASPARGEGISRSSPAFHLHFHVSGRCARRPPGGIFLMCRRRE